MNKTQIHKILYLSQLKKEYLELCLSKEIIPDAIFLKMLASAETNTLLLKNMDLSTLSGIALKSILPILKCQNHIDQIVISSQAANDIQNELASFLQSNQVDVQIKKRIPQLDLQMISASSTNLIQSSQRQNTLYKSPSHVHFNTDRLQQQLQSDRNQKNKPKQTKTINLQLKTQDSKRQLTDNEYKSTQNNYQNKTCSRDLKKKHQSNENLLETRKQSSHSFSKHKNTSSSPINNDPHDQAALKRHISAYQSSKNLTKNTIPIKTILENKQPSTTRGKQQQQLNQIVNNSQDADISIHLKNLINFCNQSIMKKSQDLTSNTSTTSTKQTQNKQKENKQPSSGRYKQSEHTMIKLAELSEEDNPETARFNSEEEQKKSPFNSKGLQKLLQLKTQPHERSLMSVFKK